MSTYLVHRVVLAAPLAVMPKKIEKSGNTLNERKGIEVDYAIASYYP